MLCRGFSRERTSCVLWQRLPPGGKMRLVECVLVLGAWLLIRWSGDDRERPGSWLWQVLRFFMCAHAFYSRSWYRDKALPSKAIVLRLKYSTLRVMWRCAWRAFVALDQWWQEAGLQLTLGKWKFSELTDTIPSVCNCWIAEILRPSTDC